ncbi:tRNA pseudouridine(38-40) synthase TruA [Thermococcus aggregans]|uniref:tRNA pseudouridine synthase A n=1 Tax=Thermococcus aggregans TaxID=110163 RepID=A0A9E7MXD4_THEAG|nr:tRNA pseudouridine(38-40) synthase TruA [Thermococcus aggregans]USS40577.1 tRNA pseudouridine(38-40) synthase TruA [Thermococcus aggregans]
MRIALKIAYDGRKFYGFQRQPNVRTVEGEIIKALVKLGIIENPKDANFKGASRTDRGVSAFGNIIAFNTSKPELTYPRILNHHLQDVWVLGRAQVPEDFHPRFWSKGKVYRYYLIDEGFDIEKMKACAQLFVGIHDFSNFARIEEDKNPIRKIDRIEILPKGKVIVVEIEGESFLWEMVRRIVTALKLCASGVLSIEDVKRMLEEKVARKLPPAPPENLVLWEVKYEGVSFEKDPYAVEKAKKEFFEKFAQHLITASIFEDWLTSL